MKILWEINFKELKEASKSISKNYTKEEQKIIYKSLDFTTKIILKLNQINI